MTQMLSKLLPILLLVHCNYNTLDRLGLANGPQHADTEEALLLVHEHYTALYPEAGPINPTVYWSSEICPGTDQTAVIYQDVCYHGYLYTCADIYVAYHEVLSDSAFAHELGHCYRLTLFRDGDRDHLDGEWWQDVADINQGLANHGL